MNKNEAFVFLNKIEKGMYEDIDEAMYNLLEVDEFFNGEQTYIWGNDEIFQDLNTEKWYYFAIDGGSFRMNQKRIVEYVGMLRNEIKRKYSLSN